MTADQTLQESCMSALRHMGVEVTALVDKANRLEAENAKLREFAESYLDAVRDCCNICPYDDVDLCDTETDPMRDGCRLYEEMRELGIEVQE